MPTTTSPHWKQLQTLAGNLKGLHLSELFAYDSQRFSDYSFEHDGILLDLSKQRINNEVLQSLFKLAKEHNLSEWIEQLFSGVRINHTENRPALHTALRLPQASNFELDGVEISTQVHRNLQKMYSLVERVHEGQWRGVTGYSINTIVNIGVGGSDLGPLMACKALSEYQTERAKSIKVHFVSSMDGSQLEDLLNKLNPARTLFIISSKSFTTIDTLANATTAREWLKHACPGFDQSTLIDHHFIAISANPQKAESWGIKQQNQLQFWDWTGGRFSLWSTIGFPIALKLGSDGFQSLLAGAHSMDLHFRDTPFEQNLPILLALTGIWNINFLDINAHAILPYDGRLSHLPAYLEQLEMESNGKSVDRQGKPIDYKTCPILWGEIGTNAQHAFYQLLHQGTQSVMCDFIVAARRYHDTDNDELKHQHQLNLANCLSQARILALGDSILDNANNSPSHKRYKGNQPCTTLLLDELSPYSFGQLIAMYEHKVFAQSVIWNINPFDQWGVELGKKVATSLLSALEPSTNNLVFDDSTNGLLEKITKKQAN